jgi:hypothetical protein
MRCCPYFAADYSIDSAALDLYIGYQYLSPEIDLNRHRTKARGRALGDFDLLFTGRSHLLLGSSRERSTLRRTYCGPWKLPINVCRGLCRAGFRVSTCLDQSVCSQGRERRQQPVAHFSHSYLVMIALLIGNAALALT